MNPLVVWLMPAKNAERTIGEALESILAQTYTHVRVIVCDDGSTDNTRGIVDAYCVRDSRVICIAHKTAQGVAHARNTLLDAVTEDALYIAWLDADDVAFPLRLETQVRFLETNQAYAGVGSAVTFVNEHGIAQGVRTVPERVDRTYTKLLMRNPFVQSAMLVRKGTYADVGRYDETLSYAEDYDMWIRMVYAGCVFGNSTAPLSAYRVHTTQGRSKNFRDHLRAGIRVRIRHMWRRGFVLYAFVGVCVYAVSIYVPRCVRMWVYEAVSIRRTVV